MKNCVKRIVVLALVLVSMFFVHGTRVMAEQNLESGTIRLSPGSDSSYNSHIEMYRDGSIKFSLAISEDSGVIPANVSVTIKTHNNMGKNETEIKNITGITSSNGITDLNIDLKEGDYLFTFALYSETGVVTGQEAVITYKIVLNDKVVEIPEPPKNVIELNVNEITTMDENSSEFNKILFGSTLKEVIIPFTADHEGGLLIGLKEYKDYYDSMSARVYKDATCSKPIGTSIVLKSGDETQFTTISIPKKGTYYIKFTLNSVGDILKNIDFGISLNLINNNVRTLKHKKVQIAYQDSDSEKMLYKLTVTKPSVIGLTMQLDDDYDFDAYFQLLDSKKKKVSSNQYSESQVEQGVNYIVKYYTLEKGTYYIQVDTICGLYSLASSFEGVKNESGSSKSNAKTIKVGGSQLGGYLKVTDKITKENWFKFTLNKDQYINFYYSTKLDGDIKIEIINEKGEIVYNDDKLLQGFYNYYRKNYWLKKGTYYFRISKSNKYDSIAYNILIK
ncbi:MAG: peptidase domain protein [Anaerocolumna sp.]|nr:peptidase domain protein [Anaerocolumna sp.]